MNNSAKYQDQAQHNGDNNFVPLTHLETAIEQIKKAYRGDEKLVDIIEDLTELITKHPEREIIGLEQKLEKGKRVDLFKRARRLKSKFSRRVAKNQMSIAEQQVYIQILAAINTAWYSSINPKIVEGATNDDIDRLIYEEIIKPIHQAVVRFDITVTSETVSGMLYFLTGKCHLIWGEEC
jgi:hypothetical protein